MRRPNIKKGMKVFLGCGIGDRRIGMHQLVLSKNPNHELLNLEKNGYIKGENDGKERWFSLTSKGKDHIAGMELFLARI